MSELLDRYESVLLKIKEACHQHGREEKDVQLIAVSKLHSIDAIIEVASFGQKHFGENYVQEALEKISLRPDLTWHAIGPIQSKKAKDIVGKFKIIQSLSTDSLASSLSKRLLADQVLENQTQDILIQVNIGKEAQKSGVMPEDLISFACMLTKYPQLNICGLMCLPPFDIEPEKTRQYFEQMRILREKLECELGQSLPHLSMGMSGDFPSAIAEGASMIRIGTDIFGTRK